MLHEPVEIMLLRVSHSLELSLSGRNILLERHLGCLVCRFGEEEGDGRTKQVCDAGEFLRTIQEPLQGVGMRGEKKSLGDFAKAVSKAAGGKFSARAPL